MVERAKQFAPFAALRGYYDLIRERERVIVDKIEFPEDMTEIISRKLGQVEKGMMVEIIHYADGEYISTKGIVSEFDTIGHSLTIVKTKILFDDIFDIIGEEIRE